ncbi:MAG: hypothetical protein WC764_00960 [Candidatus Paceibacterota bacterium]
MTIKKLLRFTGIVPMLLIMLGTVQTAQAVTIPDEIRIAANDSWSGTVPATSVLSLLGRIDYNKPAGANYPLEVYVNGKVVTSALMNKGASFTYKDGRNFPYLSGKAWMLFYSADLSANNSSAGGGYQVTTDPGQAYIYKWNIASIVGSAATMDLKLVNNGNTVGKPIVVKVISTYPIVALGNCASDKECKTYCDKQENYGACADFGAKTGLISKEDAAKAKEFADVLKGDGPGSCKDQASCTTYCSDIKNIDSCLTFAEKHNFISADVLKQGKQVAQALKAGAKLPGGCTDQKSCNTYCTASGHGGECLDFAEKAGFVSKEESEMARKVLPLIESGQSPGKCTTKDQCEKYCADNNNVMECVAFGEKAGFISKEEADLVRKTGGKGPGGCTSKASCDAYCNDAKNQTACFEFAKEHDLIPADKLKEIKDGMSQLRAGLQQAPQEVVDCLKSEVDPNIISSVEGGTYMPGPEAGGKIKACFAKYLPQMMSKLKGAMDQADSATKQCVEQAMGEGGLEGMLKGDAPPSPDAGDKIKNCFGKMKTEGLKKMRDGLKQMPEEIRTCIEHKLGKDKVAKIEAGEDVEIGPEAGAAIQSCVGNIGAVMQKMMDEQLKQAPPEIQACLKDRLSNIAERAQKGEVKGPEDVQGDIAACMKNFRPAGIPEAGSIPAGIPKGGIPKGYIPEGVPESMGISGQGESSSQSSESSGGTPPAGFVPNDQVCAGFKMAPSCDYVPENVRDICNKCKE